MRNDPLAGWLARRAGTLHENRGADDLLGEAAKPIEEVFFFASREQDLPDLLTLAWDERMDVRFASVDRVRESVERTLHLLYGVGACRSRALRQQGYPTLTALASHPQWGGAARALLERWGTTWDPVAVFRSLQTWLQASHPLFLTALGLVPRERILFFDLETLGLSNAPVFLIATARLGPQSLRVRQFLAMSLAGEASVLARFARELEQATALVSYNGKSFDWTFLRERFAYYGLPLPPARIHVDLLHHVRRRHAGSLPDAQLGTVEAALLNIRRTNDLPSALVPQFYSMYLETEDPAPLKPIVDHNRQDILSLALLLGKFLQEEANDVE